MFTHKPPIKIVATILAKDEEDIIGQNIEHHIQQGVSQFIVTNNRSTDRTRQIAEKYPEVIEIIDEPDETHNQSVSVTRMARLACKLQPDWIIHLDADELWCGLHNLAHVNSKIVGSVRMFLHPPVGEFSIQKQNRYLHFENIRELPVECKIAHRPDPDIVIEHGNHGVAGVKNVDFTKTVYRHHYPIRSYKQFEHKAVEGHKALIKRNSVCKRWENWYHCWESGKLNLLYDSIASSWRKMLVSPDKECLSALLDFWCTEDAKQVILNSNTFPVIGEWPKYAQQSDLNSGS